MKKDLFKISGMYSLQYGREITNALSRISGISSVIVNLEKSELSVEYDELKTNRVRITDNILKAGFSAKLFAAPSVPGGFISHAVQRARDRTNRNMREAVKPRRIKCGCC